MYTESLYRDGVSSCISLNILGYKVNFVNPTCIRGEDTVDETAEKPTSSPFHIEDIFLNLSSFTLENKSKINTSVFD